MATAEARRGGARHVAPLLEWLSFGQYNAAFKPIRTDYDWLSRDEAEVDRYVADPLCGDTPDRRASSSTWSGGLVDVNDRRKVARVRRDLPILLLSGDKCQVGANGEGPREVREQYASVGIVDVTCTLYPGARHEIFNETNRDEVTADLIGWLDAHLPA